MHYHNALIKNTMAYTKNTYSEIKLNTICVNYKYFIARPEIIRNIIKNYIIMIY